MLITSDMTRKELARAFRRGAATPAGLSPSLSSAQLVALAERNSGASWKGLLFDLIAAHANADDSVLRVLLTLGPDEGTENTVVTSPRASRQLVRDLLGSQFASVREHARFAVVQFELRDKLDAASADEFLVVYSSHRDGSAESITARLIVALHPRLPESVAELLSKDEDAMVARTARNRNHPNNGR